MQQAGYSRCTGGARWLKWQRSSNKRLHSCLTVSLPASPAARPEDCDLTNETGFPQVGATYFRSRTPPDRGTVRAICHGSLVRRLRAGRESHGTRSRTESSSQWGPPGPVADDRTAARSSPGTLFRPILFARPLTTTCPFGSSSAVPGPVGVSLAYARAGSISIRGLRFRVLHPPSDLSFCFHLLPAPLTHVSLLHFQGCARKGRVIRMHAGLCQRARMLHRE